MKLSKQRKAELWLILVTFFWGASYYLTDLSLTELSPVTLNAFRFLLAFLVLGTIFHKRLRTINRRTIQYSVMIGLALLATNVSTAYGVRLTSLTNAGFLCALPVVITPLLNLVFLHKKPDAKFLPAMMACLTGLAMLTLTGGMTVNAGDLLCILASACFAVDIIITEHAVKETEVDALNLGICQLGVVGILAMILAFLLEKPHLPATPQVWGAVLFLGLFCSGAAFVIQAVQQQYTTSEHVGLIFTLEPVFASIVSYVVVGERLSRVGYTGAFLMMLSLIFMEVDLTAAGRILRTVSGVMRRELHPGRL